MAGGETKTCPKCGEPWTPWAGTALESHAKCHFAPEVQDEIMREWQNPATTLRSLAEKYGVTWSVIRASIHVAMVRAGRPGLR